MTYIKILIRKTTLRRTLLFTGIFIFSIIIAISLYQVVYADKIFPRVQVGTVEVGSMTRSEALEKLERKVGKTKEQGVSLLIEGKSEHIRLENIGFEFSADESVDLAWFVGRRGSLYRRFRERLRAPFAQIHYTARIELNREDLENEIAVLAQLYDKPRVDIRFDVKNEEVSILKDTKSGKFLDREDLSRVIFESFQNLDSSPISISLKNDFPQVDPQTIPKAREEAERIVASSLTLVYKEKTFPVNKKEIGSWIISGYEGNRLVPYLDENKISVFVTDIAGNINTPAQDVKVRVVDSKVVEFIPPQPGKLLEEDETVKLITNALNERRGGKESTKEISLPVTVKKPLLDESASSLRITELIGTATTSLAGSPQNRIHNIKNGVKFLTGILIPPGEEFSTIEALGKIDNTTGYLPELVIKENRTIPEFGGGLCQVSTTLFRAVLNAGLPITARRNHSYRVPYYEKDGGGNVIGPGLDATIYRPNPDLRFVNDTGSTILIQGYVKGDKVTFELYGTSDGRTAAVDGPHTLSTIPAGAPIYVETDTLLKGVTKRIEIAHPGGSAIATYKITYPDGQIKEQVFKSSYRQWPARYLVGTREEQP